MEDDRLMEILALNKDKSFVQRILKPKDYPSLDLGGGKTASHKMSWAESEGKYHVFPTILYGPDKQLHQYTDWKEAWDNVKETGNFIEFDTPEEADDFSKNYKRYWKMGK